MYKIGILGGGSFGMALMRALQNSGNEVSLWTRHSEKLDLYAKERIYHPLSDMVIPHGVIFDKDISLLCRDKDVIIVAVPSVYVRDTIEKAAPFLKEGELIASVTKGMEKETLLSPTGVIEDEIKKIRGDEFNVSLVALSGPSHAEEVARDLPTTIVSSSMDMRSASFMQEVFDGTCIRVYTNSDIKGVELCGALKNIIALATGVSQGLGYGDNTKAALITRGLAEMWRLGFMMGCKIETFSGLAGLGDLVVTCTSMNSRNNRCGILIGKGVPPEEAKKQIGMAVEGINTLPAAMMLKERYKVEMPITEITNAVINKEISPVDAVNILMSREKKDELW